MQAFRIFALCAFFGLVSSSAIPMWEYLTQNEKVMYLFNMFQSQVQDFCKNDACKQDLKNYGWKKLKAMDEDSLDLMDPFQRGSNDIIWESVMEGHKIMDNKKPKPSTTPKSNFYEDDAFDANQEASAKIETVYKVAPPKGFNPQRPQIIVGSGTPEYKKPMLSFPSSNAIQESTTENAPVYENYGPYGNILTGPWVVRVHPDGTPVRESTQAVPEDDDLRLYQMTKVILQNL